VSLHRVDPRFVLPHAVRRAVVLDGLEEWRVGLASVGIEVSDQPGDRGSPDIVVSPARLAAEARSTGAQSVIIEGSRERTFRGGDYRTRRLLLRPNRSRPTLALPFDQPAPVSYALERWSVVDRRWKAARMRAARALVVRGLFPSWASPVVTVATRTSGPPSFVAAAGDLGIPREASWFLTFGQGDALSRNAFQLFRAGSDQPAWVLKFARVAGYSERFDNDERGLRLARRAGDTVAAHVPRLVGRFDVDGVHASLETAAAGRRLRDILLTPGDRAAKVRLIERIGDWILEFGRLMRTSPEAMGAERKRLRADVVPHWRELGVDSRLVDELPPLPAVAQHNDFGSWNVVADDGDFVVVDWENVREAALPLWDLLYFLGDAFVLLDGAPGSPARLPPRMTRLFAGEAPSSPLLFSLVRRGVEKAAVPPDAVGAIATLCWLSHSVSTRDHNRDIATFAPGDPPRVHGLEGIAWEWMAHPALGPGWRVWRG
jgi:Phosphotransferase enzyme family